MTVSWTSETEFTSRNGAQVTQHPLPGAEPRRLERLRQVPFEVVLDRHRGVTELGRDAIPKVVRFR